MLHVYVETIGDALFIAKHVRNLCDAYRRK